MGYRVSFIKPDDFVAGGLVSNVDVEFRECRWETYDYDGKSEKPAIAFAANLHIVDKDGNVEEEIAGGRRQYWSAGDGSKFIPVEDGRYLEAEDEHAKLNSSSNFAVFRAQHENQGFVLPDSDASLYNGLRAHVVRIPAPERGNMQPQVGEDGKTRTKEILVITKIIQKPGAAKSASKVAKAPIRGVGAGSPTKTPVASSTPAPASTTPNNDNATPESIAEEVIASIVGDDPSQFPGMTRADFNKKSLQLMMPNGDHPVKAASQRNQVLALIKNDEWLNPALEAYGLASDGENVGLVE